MSKVSPGKAVLVTGYPWLLVFLVQIFSHPNLILVFEKICANDVVCSNRVETVIKTYVDRKPITYM
jgi:hypothetical protein